MARPTLYVAITNHGFGHATRTASVVEAIQNACPDLLVIVTTAAPRWLLESYIGGDFIYRPRAFDIGVIQQDCLQMDKVATLSHLYDIRIRQADLIASEVDFMRQNGVGLILADIPPLMGLIAQAAQLPCWMLGNFGWDFIYRAWGDDFQEVADWISDCFGVCDRLFRLPFHEPMKAFSTVEDVGFVGGTPHFSPEQLRETFHIEAAREQTAMITFGGLNLQQIPYEGLRQYPDWQFITFDQQAPDLPNLCKIRDRRYRPVDFMPLCGRIISKPGYGTFAEACRTGTGIVSLEREDFAEAEILLSGIQHYAPHQILPAATFYEGTWEFLHTPLSPPTQPDVEILDGNLAIAEAIAAFFA
jgi:hypothetical protein